MADFDGTVAIAIEGIGFDTSQSKGAALFWGDEPANDTGNYEWVYSLLEPPPGLETLIEPVIGRTTVSAFTFKIRRSDSLAQALLYHQSMSRMALSADVSKSATSLTVTNTTGSVPASSSVIWIEDEAILVGTNAGGGSLTGCTRGYWGTTAKAHDSGRFVFTKQNSVRFRGVSLIVLDASDTPVIIWRGYINGVKSAKAGTQIQVSCLEGNAETQNIQVNRGAPNMLSANQNAVRLQTGALDADDNYRFVEVAGTLSTREHYRDRADAWLSRVFKFGEANTKPVAVQIGKALTLAVVNGSHWEFQNFPALLGSEFETNEDSRTTFVHGGEQREGLRIEGAMYEVAVISKEIDAWISTNTALDPVSFTRDLDYPYHPLSAVAAVWLSDEATSNDLLQYNVLNGRFWGGDMVRYATNSILNKIPNLIEETRELEIDQLVLGWDGKPVDIWTWGISTLRSWGFFVGFDEQGEFTIERLRLIDVEEYDAALSNQVKVRSTPDGQPYIDWEAAYDETYSTIFAKVGELPWQDGLEVAATVDGVSPRASKAGSKKALTYDFSTVSRERWAALRETLENTSILLYSAMPRLTVWVEDPEIDSLDYDMGAIVTLDELPMYRGSDQLAWLLDSDGEPTTQQDGIAFAGRIVGRQFNLGSRTYRLRMLLTNYKFGAFTRWRAPSMEITGYTDNGDGTYTLDCASTSQFGYEDSDAEAFYVSDAVEVWTRSVARDMTAGIAGEWTISAVAAGSVTTNSGPTVDPTGGFLRLAPWDPASGGYNNPTIFTNIERAWVYLADSEEPPTLGVSEDEADIYG